MNFLHDSYIKVMCNSHMISEGKTNDYLLRKPPWEVNFSWLQSEFPYTLEVNVRIVS